MTLVLIASIVAALTSIVAAWLGVRSPAWAALAATLVAVVMLALAANGSPQALGVALSALGAALVAVSSDKRGASAVAGALALGVAWSVLGPAAELASTSLMASALALWPALAAGAGVALWIDESAERAPRALVLGASAAILATLSVLDDTLGIALMTGVTDEVGTPVEVVTHWAEGSLAMATAIHVRVPLPWAAPLLAVIAAVALVAVARPRWQDHRALRALVGALGAALIVLAGVMVAGQIVPPQVTDPVAFGQAFAAPFAPADAVAIPYPSAPNLRFSTVTLSLLVALGGFVAVLGALTTRERAELHGVRWLLGGLLVLAAAVAHAAAAPPGVLDPTTLLAPLLGLGALAIGPRERPQLAALLVGAALALVWVRLIWGIP